MPIFINYIFNHSSLAFQADERSWITTVQKWLWAFDGDPLQTSWGALHPTDWLKFLSRKSLRWRNERIWLSCPPTRATRRQTAAARRLEFVDFWFVYDDSHDSQWLDRPRLSVRPAVHLNVLGNPHLPTKYELTAINRSEVVNHGVFRYLSVWPGLYPVLLWFVIFPEYLLS